MRGMHGLGKPRTHWLIALMAMASFAPAVSWADADGEFEALARLVHEIDALTPLIEGARSQADPDARIRFRYDWLRQDLARIRSGIQDHLDAPRTEPRTFPPLRGDYRQ